MPGCGFGNKSARELLLRFPGFPSVSAYLIFSSENPVRVWVWVAITESLVSCTYE